MTCCVNPDVTVTIKKNGGALVGLVADPISATIHTEGGARVATVELCNYTGDLSALLGAEVAIGDCWCGYVAGVYRACGEVAWGASTDNLYNRVAVYYRVGQEERQTAWAENTASQALYGVRELLVELPADSLLTAEAFQDRILAETAATWPLLLSRLNNTLECGITTLICRGWWDTLDWTYDRQLCGYATSGYIGTGGPRPLGLGFVSTGVGFRGGVVPGAIGTPGADLLAFPVGDEIVISGAGDPDNNVSTTIERRISSSVRTLADSSISFDLADDIKDLWNRLGLFVVGELITVAGSLLNDGAYFIKRALTDGDRLEVTPATIALEAAGAAVTLIGGVTVAVAGELDSEAPGATVTIRSRTQYVCQRVRHDGKCDQPWTVNHVRLPLRKVGNPTDSLVVGAGTSCVAADVAMVAGADLSGTFAEIDVIFATGVVLNPGGEITITLTRSGAPSTTDYYEFASVTDSTLLPAQISVDGINWSIPQQPYTLSLEVFEDEAITDQAHRIALAWPYVNTVTVVAPVAYKVPTYREGKRTLKEELQRLIFCGAPDGQRMQVTIDCERNVIIGSEPTLGDGATVVDCDGCAGLDACALGAGRWVKPAAGIVTPGDFPAGVWLEQQQIVFNKCRARLDGRSFDLRRYGVIFAGE